MPLDTRLPLMANVYKPITREQAAQNGFTLRGLKRSEDEANSALSERQTIRDLYQRSVQADGSVDNAAFERSVAESGLGDKLPEIQKGRATLEKTQGETQAGKFKLAKDRADALAGGLSSLLSNPNVTHEAVYAQLNSLVDSGVISADQGAAAARGLPGRPEQLRPFLVQQALGAADASKRLEALIPKYDEQDRGGSINQGTIDPLTGQRTAGADVTKTLTPGEIQSGVNAETLAGSGGSVQTDANTGQMVFVPNKVPLGQPVKTRPVTNGAGAPVVGKSLNDSQSKALLFGTRAQEAAKIMTDLEAKGVNRPSVIKDVAGSIPGIGGALAAGANMTLVSPEQQQLDQAQRDFVNAVLRRESGSAINKDEFTNAKAQYFPALGDSPEVIAQKAQNRDLAMRGLLSEVPEGMRGQINPAASQPVAAPPGARPPLSAFGTAKR